MTGGNATGGGTDYTLAAGTLTFTAGDTSEDITITLTDDAIDEADETVEITLSTPVNTTLGAINPHTFTITDNDAGPDVAFTVDTSTASEGAGTATITVDLSGNATEQTVTVDYAVTGGSATGSGSDYTLAAGTLTFTAGDTSEDITVALVDDSIDEADETVEVTLSNPGNATLGATTLHTLTITDNDAPPEVAFAAATSSADEGAGTATITATLTGSTSEQTVTVDYAVTGGNATGGGTDYTLAAGTLTFAPGETSAAITVPLVDDSEYELDETVEIELTGPVNATLGAITLHTLTITDNDQPTVQFQQAASTVAEDGGSTTITVTLTAPVLAGDTITVPFSVVGGTAGAADYVLATSSPLVFNPGDDLKAITVNITSDLLDEANETVILELGTPDGATPGTLLQHTLTIQDDDLPPAVDFTSATSSIAETGGTATIPVTLTAASGLTVTVNYAASGDAVNGLDYDLPNGSLTFAPGTTSQNIVVDIIDDDIFELTEQVTITLSGSSNATLGTANNPHTLDIVDNDGPPYLEFILASSSVDEDAGTIDIGVRMSVESSSDITIEYAATGGSAVAGTDYTAIPGGSTLLFPSGTTEQTFTVSISDNVLYQADRTLEISLSNPTNPTDDDGNPNNDPILGGRTTHTVTIEDNDGPNVNFAAESASIQEGDPAGQFIVTLNLDEPILTGESASLQLVVSGTAQDGDDFAVGTSVVFNSGDQSKQRIITIFDDDLDELNETVVLTILIPLGENLNLDTPSVFTLTIEDDDETPVAVNDSYTVNEDTTLTVSASTGVLSNDTDGDDDTLTATVLTQPGNGTLTFNGNGAFTYVPNPNFFGTDTFTYNASDGTNTSTAATVTITVNPVNDAPVASNDRFAVVTNAPTVLNVLANDTDVENNALTVSQVSQPAQGTVTISNGGANVTYTPNAAFRGQDSFTYTVCDNGTPQECDTAMVFISVLSGQIYLPLLFNGGGPDLVVKSIITNPSKDAFQSGQVVAGNQVEITVEIENRGSRPTDRQFWVDLYIDPVLPSGQNIPQINQRWNDLCAADADPSDPCYYGIVWLVEQTLDPGESITLTSTSIATSFSRWPGYFVSGTDDLYVQVDSWNPGLVYGAIYELTESNNTNSLLDIGVSGNNPFLQAELTGEIPERP